MHTYRAEPTARTTQKQWPHWLITTLHKHKLNKQQRRQRAPHRQQWPQRALQLWDQ
jgi:hypothetical protein